MCGGGWDFVKLGRRIGLDWDFEVEGVIMGFLDIWKKMVLVGVGSKEGRGMMRLESGRVRSCVYSFVIFGKDFGFFFKSYGKLLKSFK